MKTFNRLVILIITVMIMIYVISCSPSENYYTTSEDEDTFITRDIISGKTVTFPDEWQGDVIYLNFFMST